MGTTAGIGLHVDPSEITHHHHPADDSCHEYGTLTLGKPGHAAYAHLFFEDAAAIIAIDAAIAELVALKQEMAPPVLDVKAPAPDGDWCPASTDTEDFGATIYCDREPGHPGSHHAPGPDEGSEVAWSDTPAQALASTS